MGELFEVDVRTINEHLKKIHTQGEQTEKATIWKFRIVQKEGTRSVSFYNLEAIISVGYCVNSIRATQFK